MRILIIFLLQISIYLPVIFSGNGAEGQQGDDFYGLFYAEDVDVGHFVVLTQPEGSTVHYAKHYAGSDITEITEDLEELAKKTNTKYLILVPVHLVE